MSLATRASRARHDPGTALWAAAATGWLALIVAALAVSPRFAHHHGVADALGGPGRSVAPVLAVFFGAWLVMVAAMMLPTMVPMTRMFHTVTVGSPHRHLARATFLTGYFGVWLGFAIIALLGDLGVHAAVEAWPWLAARDGLVLAGALALAGVTQFSSLKQRCLTGCRDPRAMLYQHYRRGAVGTVNLAIRHGLSCLGCCWALMLVMFATGVGSLLWMAGLTAVMVAEKTTRWGPRIVPAVGVVLLLAACGLAAAELMPATPGGGEHPHHQHTH